MSIPPAATEALAVVNGLHDAFISYSRQDKIFAFRLEKALEDYSIPAALRGARRRMDVFRDEEDFTGTEYYQALNKHLTASRALVVICSPAARASRYVDEEIRMFAEAKGTEHIIPVLIGGIPNNEASPGQEALMAFPQALVERMKMPLAIPYLGFNDAKNKVHKDPFEHSWFSLLANLLGVARSEIEQREKKRQARVRNYWIGGLASISSVLLALSIWALAERNIAARQRDEALRSQSTFLAQESRQQLEFGKHDLAIKLALHALPRRLDRPDRPWVQAAESALYAAVAQQSFRLMLGGKRAGFGETLRDARISPDGLRAALDYGIETELWNLESGELIKVLRGDTESSYASGASFSPDGSYLGIGYWTLGNVVFRDEATGTTTLRGSVFEIVDAKTGTLIRHFQTEGHRKNHLQFSPSGKSLFVATDEQFLLIETTKWTGVWGASWQKDTAELAPPYSTVLFSEDETKVALVTKSGWLAVLDVASRSILVRIHTGASVAGAAFVGRHDGSIAMAVQSGITVLNPTDLTQAQLPVSGSNKILALGFAPARSTLIAVTDEARLRSWPRATERIEINARRPGGVGLRSAKLDELGTAALVEFKDGAVEFWDVATGLRHTLLPADEKRQLLSVSFDRKGQTALLASSDSDVRVWERGLARVAGSNPLADSKSKTAAAFRPRTNHLAIGDKGGSVAIRDAASGDRVWEGKSLHRGEIHCLTFDAAGTRLISGGADRAAIIWDIAGDRPPMRLEGHQNDVDFCAFSLDGQFAVTGSRDSTFRLWDASTGRVRRVLPIPERYLDPIHNASINAQAAFTTDGKLLVTVTSGDGYAIGQPALVWDVESGRLLQALQHPSAAIWDIAITADNRRVVTTSYDNTAVLWDINSGKMIQTFQGHSTTILRALVVDRGRLLVTASGDGLVRVSRLSTGQLVHQWKVGENLFNMQMSGDGRLLALGSNSAQEAVVEIWDPIVAERLVTIRLSGVSLSPLHGLAFSPDGRTLMTRTRAGEISVRKLPLIGQELVDWAWAHVARSGRELLTQEQRIRFAIEPP